MKDKNIDKFLINLRKIINNSCFEVYFSVRSMIVLNIGQKVVSDPPIFLFPTKTDFLIEGEYSLEVIHSWQIIINDRLYCNEEYDENDGSYQLLEQKVKILENKLIKEIVFYEKTFNISIEFEDNIKFEALCYIGDKFYTENDYDKDDTLFRYKTLESLFSLNPFGVLYQGKINRIYLKDYKKN